jgi:hypothetical protein
MNSADRSTATRQIHRYSLLTVIALLFAVPACGSSDVGQRTITEPVSEPASNGTSTSTTTTNTTGQPSTTERPLSEENTRDLALAATTNEEDFDRGWSKYSTPDGHTREPSKCAEEADSVLNKNAIHHGPTMEFLGGLAFFTTEARVFSSEDEASTWLTCRRERCPGNLHPTRAPGGPRRQLDRCSRECGASSTPRGRGRTPMGTSRWR